VRGRRGADFDENRSWISTKTERRAHPARWFVHAIKDAEGSEFSGLGAFRMQTMGPVIAGVFHSRDMRCAGTEKLCTYRMFLLCRRT